MQVYSSLLMQQPPFSPLASRLWAELYRCSHTLVAHQGLNRRPHFAPLASRLWAELCRCSAAPIAHQGLKRQPHFAALACGLWAALCCLLTCSNSVPRFEPTTAVLSPGLWTLG